MFRGVFHFTKTIRMMTRSSGFLRTIGMVLGGLSLIAFLSFITTASTDKTVAVVAKTTRVIEGTNVISDSQTENDVVAGGRSDQSLTIKPNLLFLLSDQLMFNALGFVQERMADFDGKLHVRTPNIDALAKRGIYFENAYCVCPVCAPARTSIKTGTTVQRHGVLGNGCVDEAKYKRMDILKKRINKQVSFEQVLVEKVGLYLLPMKSNLPSWVRLF
jgi:Sulfatase